MLPGEAGKRGERSMERITSRSNPLIVRVRKLSSDGAYRAEQGAFVCDGKKLLEEALRWHSNVRAVLFAEGTPLPPLPEQVRAVEVPPELLRYAAPSKTPQGVLCVCAAAGNPLPERLSGRRYLALDGVQDPGNVGTILRTADAFGADGVFLLPGCADLYSPKTVRATMGAVFRLPAWRCTAEELGKLLRQAELPLYGAALREDARDLRELDLSRFAAAIGSEGRGLSAEALALCSGVVRIPMRPRCESLNAAMAAGILLWEAARNG